MSPDPFGGAEKKTGETMLGDDEGSYSVDVKTSTTITADWMFTPSEARAAGWNRY
jgi:hypothetical protein